MRFLLLLLFGSLFRCIESQTQKFGPGTENRLLQILKEAEGKKWNEQVEQGMRIIIEDEEKGTDPKKEGETVKNEIALAYKRLLLLDPSTEMTLKEDFRKELGDAKAAEVFRTAESIMWKELQEQAKIDQDLGFKTSQKKAFEKLVHDVEKGKDPLQERTRIVSKIREDAVKMLSLSPEEQEEEKYRLYALYGTETTEKVLKALQIFDKEVKNIAAADENANNELHGQPADQE